MNEKKPFTIALAGNPNCGKTTLFNLLTKSGEAVGNRAGVTFTPKKAKMRRIGGFEADIVDLPGIYSMEPYGNEEKAAERYIKSGNYDAVINIMDATNPERGLLLTLQLIEAGAPVVLALNMMDEAKKEAIEIDISTLSAILGIPVFPISAAHGTGISALADGARHVQKARPFGRGADSRTLCAKAQEIVQKTVKRPRPTHTITDRIDKLICRPIVGIPLFFAVIFLVFTLTFSGLGGMLSAWLEDAFSALGTAMQQGLLHLGVPELFRHFLTDGVFAGVASVLSFMPQTAILFCLLAVLEDSGYMARAAFVMDGALRPFGLSGKAFIPILIGFGCTVPAVMSTATLEEEEKESTIYSLPFIPCNARLPIFLLIISSFFQKHAGVAAFLLYVLGIAVAVLSALIHTRASGRKAAPPLTVELPKYRMPRPVNLMREIGNKLRDFIVRAGTVVFLSCVIISLLGMLTPTLSIAENGTDSILAVLGKWFAPLFSIIGIGDGRIVSALAAGFFAKESIVSTIEILMPEGLSAVLSTAGAASLAVFSLLYAPCVATVSAIRRELGTKKALLVTLRCFLIAFLLAFLTYTGFKLFFFFC